MLREEASDFEPSHKRASQKMHVVKDACRFCGLATFRYPEQNYQAHCDSDPIAIWMEEQVHSSNKVY
jgi:hypothetical protein